MAELRRSSSNSNKGKGDDAVVDAELQIKCCHLTKLIEIKMLLEATSSGKSKHRNYRHNQSTSECQKIARGRRHRRFQKGLDIGGLYSPPRQQ